MMRWLVRLALAAVGLMTGVGLAAVIGFRFSNQTNGTLVSSRVLRTYLLYVPKSYDPSVPTPLVIALHGLIQWPANLMAMSRWNDLADQHGFIVVYPSGTGIPLRWRSGGASSVDGSASTDVTFISDLIDTLASEYNVDPARVYANGLSNGGGMSFALSCELSERIAAVGMVAGAYHYPLDKCSPTRPVPAIIFHGTADPIVPFLGRPAGRSGAPLPAIRGWVDALAHRNGCSGIPEKLPTSGDVSGVQYKGCAADVVFYTVEGGGHTWPGAKGGMEWLVGHTSQYVDATRLMWDFFSQHSLPNG